MTLMTLQSFDAMINVFSRIVCTSAFFLLMSLNALADDVDDFFSAPEGVSIQVKNNSSFPWSVNEQGVLVSGMHKDYRSASITYTNNSSFDLCCQFEWSVSSESNCDNLGFSCNGSYPQTISGNMYYRGSLVYQRIFCYVKAGQSLEFSYSKDGSSSSGDDSGYVRNLKFSLPTEGDTDVEWGFSLAPLGTSNFASVIGYYGDEGDVTVPSVINRGGVSYTVDYIEYEAFRENKVLTSLVMSDGIEEIGVNAFKDCHCLVSVEIPNTVTGIDPQAFQGCSNLRKVKLPEGIKELKQLVFDGCSSLESIDIPSTVQSIGNYTFRNCQSLESVDIPNSVVLLDNFAFDGCSGLKSVLVPASVVTINDNVFTSCKSIERIEVASANPYYDSRDGCNAIISKKSDVLITGCKSTVIPDGVVGIGTNAFYGCSELKHIDIPESVLGLGLGAFQNCTSLRTIEMPSVVMIGAYAFYNCTGLRSVVFSDYLQDIAHAAFYNCSSLQCLDLPQSLQNIDEAAFEYCKSLTSATIPASVTSLLADVFAYCENLRFLETKGELTEVASTAFRHCANLSYVIINNRSLVQVTSNRSFDAGYTSGHYTPFSSCILYVPATSVEAFSTATGWKQFGNIMAKPDLASYSVYANDVETQPARQLKLSVMMNNEGPISCVQTDFKLPEGFSLSKVQGAVALAPERVVDTDITLTYGTRTDGTIRVLARSASGESFIGNSGLVFDILVDAEPSVKVGEHFVEFVNTQFIDPNRQTYTYFKCISKVRVLEPLRGDVNADGVVDIRDVDAIANILTGNHLPNYILAAADIDSDGQITILDCVALTSILLSGH